MMPDYVYTYPPRQAFARLDPNLCTDASLARALTQTPLNFNVYVHVPFCRQICGFCNLYAIAGKNTLAVFEPYVDAVLSELRQYYAMLGEQDCRTVYIGGGTPALMPVNLLDRLITGIENVFPGARLKTTELCLEAAPEVLDSTTAREWRSLGITRLSLGSQSFNSVELRTLGRRHDPFVTANAIDSCLSLGFPDVCVDLINGLPDQTRESWVTSVATVAKIRPPTICTYNLTSRPVTGFHLRQLALPDERERYHRYSLAQDLILSAGYHQETNVRYVIPGVGGYRQKINHWAGGTILGLGLGSRTYTPTLHYQCHSGSVAQRPSALAAYMDPSRTARRPLMGFILSPEEQVRRALALNAHSLTRATLLAAAESGLHEQVSETYDYLVSNGLAVRKADDVCFTDSGHAYRDIISHSFFSPQVRERSRTYKYA